jgi:hypothetical protein
VDGEDLDLTPSAACGRVPEDKGLELARQLLRRGYLRPRTNRGVLHRDLKPAT